MWNLIFGWPTIAIVVPVIVAFGWVVVALPNPNFNLAQWAFTVAAAVLTSRLCWWLLLERGAKDYSFWHVMGASFVIFGSVGALWMAGLIWVDGLRPPSSTATEPPNPPKVVPEVSITRLEAHSPRDRPGENNWAVTFWVNTSRPLHASMLYVRGVLYAADKQHTLIPLVVPSDLEVARYRIGKPAFEPSENTKEERYSLFVSPPTDGTRLRLLTNRRAEAALKDMRDNLPQGYYRFQLEVVAANLEEPYRGCVGIEWHGDMNTIVMDTTSGECSEAMPTSQ